MCRDMRTYIPALSFEHTQRAHTPSRRENEERAGGENERRRDRKNKRRETSDERRRRRRRRRRQREGPSERQTDRQTHTHLPHLLHGHMACRGRARGRRQRWWDCRSPRHLRRERTLRMGALRGGGRAKQPGGEREGAARRAVSGHRFPRAAARAVLQAWHRIAVPRVHIVAPRGAARRCAACPPLLVHAGALQGSFVRHYLGLECCAGLSSHAPLTDTSPAAPPDQRTCGAHPPHVGCRRRAGQVRMSQVTLARPTRQ